MTNQDNQQISFDNQRDNFNENISKRCAQSLQATVDIVDLESIYAANATHPASAPFAETKNSLCLTNFAGNALTQLPTTATTTTTNTYNGIDNNNNNNSDTNRSASYNPLCASKNNLMEFKEFLKQMQALQKSIEKVPYVSGKTKVNPEAKSDGKQIDEIVDIVKADPMLGIEVGIEPIAAMDFDEDCGQQSAHAEKALQHVLPNAAVFNAASNVVVANNKNKNETYENVRVTVGIDKDLEMILEMDPSIVDLGDVAVTEPVEPRVIGLPPTTGGPTFKTTVPKSRTQLKLQLQREQQQQELERREAEKRAIAAAEAAALQQEVETYMAQQLPPNTLPNQQLTAMAINNQQHYNAYKTNNNSNNSSDEYRPTASGFGVNFEGAQINQKSNYSTQSPSAASSGKSSSPVTLKKPLQSIGVDVPKQVLQVRTVLENPTRYHVIQKQKNQVRQYLSESFKNEWENNSASILNMAHDSNQQFNNFPNNSDFACANSGAIASNADSARLRPHAPNSATTSGMLDDPMQLSPSAYGLDSVSNNVTTAGNCQFLLTKDENSVKSFGGDSAYKNSLEGHSSSLTGGNRSVVSGRSSGTVNYLRNANLSNVSTASPVQSAPMSPISSVATSASEMPMSARSMAI